jgi:hypothetical protein
MTNPEHPHGNPDAQESLRTRVDAAIEECVKQDCKVGGRQHYSIFEVLNISPNNVEAGKIVRDSLEEVLKNGSGFHRVALGVTLLHDFPMEVGGGGFSGNMMYCPDIRKQLLEKLLNELEHKEKGQYARRDSDFEYVYNRVLIIPRVDSQLQNLGIDDMSLTGNELIKAVIQGNLRQLYSET